MKLYKVYLFDFDYTLADSSRGIVMCFRNVLERHQHTGITDGEIKRTTGKTLQESFPILTGITDADTLEAYKKEYVKEADVHMTVNTFLFPETEEVLTRLKTRGAKIGIISTKYRYRIMELLSKKLPSNFLDIIVGGEVKCILQILQTHSAFSSGKSTSVFFGHLPASYTLYYIITVQCSQWSSFKTTAS